MLSSGYLFRFIFNCHFFTVIIFYENILKRAVMKIWWCKTYQDWKDPFPLPGSFLNKIITIVLGLYFENMNFAQFCVSFYCHYFVHHSAICAICYIFRIECLNSQHEGVMSIDHILLHSKTHYTLLKLLSI